MIHPASVKPKVLGQGVQATDAACHAVPAWCRSRAVPGERNEQSGGATVRDLYDPGKILQNHTRNAARHRVSAMIGWRGNGAARDGSDR
jgi:hypothetical protein